MGGAGAVATRSRPTQLTGPILAEPGTAQDACYHRHPMTPARPLYTIDEANALMPQVRAVLLQLAVEQRRLDTAHAEMHRQLDADGDPSAGAEAARREAENSRIRDGMQSLLAHLGEMGIELRDIEMGLVDFPGEREGEQVWLCWRMADPSVAYWHRTDEGYATRKPW